MLLLRRLILVFSFVAGGVISVRGATNIISGQVTTNSIWSGTNLLTGTVTIQTNIVVTIEPGTQMLMNTGATVIVYGQLLANGSTNQPINFTRATTTARWSRIRFVAAADSAFRNCVFEYANCAGDHQAYYDNDCNTNTPPLARTYTEAIVALATHLDIEDCVFRNLVGGAGGNEGDAISIISDDIQVTGPASANVRRCRFEGIGQGVHTRFSYVLVENCVFSDKHGDNDDIDMYGESTPPPLIRRNLFLPGHEDKINPTRCSAIIVENVFIGSDDHGVVLRDRCAPIVLNNLIINCANACIAVQNQCDAFIANNTLRNSARGIRFFDHTTRRGPPYCLFPGSGRATIVNNVIWDCTTSFELQDSPDTTIDSFADVSYCNVEGGQATASVAPSSTLVWGPGNFNLDPRFVSIANTNFHLLTNSPCIDAGTNLSAVVSNDLDRLPRPLDGNGDGTNAFDIGAYEVLLATADSNGDGIPDGWAWSYGFSPLDPNVAGGNADNDAQNNLQEWIADTNPTNELSFFHITAISNVPPITVYVPSSSNRVYTLSYATNLLDPVTWTNVPGQVDVRGTGGLHGLTDSDGSLPERYYRVNVKVP